MDKNTNETNAADNTQTQTPIASVDDYAVRDETPAQSQTISASQRPNGNVFVAAFRRLISGLLVSLCLVALMLNMAAFWIKGNIASTDAWTDKASRLIENAAIRSSISTSLAEQIFSQATVEAASSGQAVPTTLPDGSTKESIKKRIDSILQSDRFTKLWTDINRSAHQGLTNSLANNGDADQKTKDTKVMYIENSQLIFASRSVIASIRPILIDGGFDIASTIDISKVSEKSSLMTIGSLPTVMTFVDLFDKAVIFLPVIFLALLVGSLAVSPDRRRTLLKIGWSVALFVAPLAFLPEIVSYMSSTEANSVDPSILQAFISIFISEIAVTSLIILSVALIVVMACYACGTSRLAKYTRISFGKAIQIHGSSNTFLGWIARHSNRIIVLIACSAMVLIVTQLGKSLIYYVTITSVASALAFIVTTISQGFSASEVVK